MRRRGGSGFGRRVMSLATLLRLHHLCRGFRICLGHCVIDKGTVVPSVPQIHARRETAPDVLCPDRLW